MRSILVIMFFTSLASTIYSQDEAYANETRDNIFDTGTGYYSISYGSDFDKRMRVTAQIKGIVARNLSTGTNFIYSRDKNKFNNWGLGWSLQNYFLNGNTRPFLEVQVNAKASKVKNVDSNSYNFNAEGSINAGLAYFIDITDGYFSIEMYAQYYQPIFTEVSFEKGLIPSIRVGFVY